MSELDALLRACKADPTDDAVRRVLADYLEEQGDAERAEFVRLQLDTPDQGRGQWDATAAEREAPQLRLLRKNVAAWLGGTFAADGWCNVPGASEGVTGAARFDRGLAHVQYVEPLEELPLALPAEA